jgi:hypothetical protein
MDRERFSMPKPPVATEIHQSFDVHGNFGAKFSLDFIFAINNFPDIINFRFRELIGLEILINIEHGKNFPGCAPPDPVNVRQPDFNPFVFRQIDAGNSCQGVSSFYPCRCLCRLFSQITRITPFLRTILHLLHIFFTDGLTFILFHDSFPKKGPPISPGR